MTTTTLLLLLLSVIVACGVVFFQYFYKAKNQSNVTWLLAFLRFIAVFGVLVLLINPILSRKTFDTIKTPLPIVVDNSSSIADLKASETALSLYKTLTSNSALREKFDIQSYRFDADFQASDAFDFKGKQTNVEERLIVSCLVGEQIRLFNSDREAYKRWIGPLTPLAVNII